MIVTGRETLVWDQPAPNPTALGAYSYVSYVDGVRQLLQEARCASEPIATGYACAAPMPTLSPGRHAIQLAAVTAINGHPVEGPRSAPLIVRSVLSPSAPSDVAEQHGPPTGQPVSQSEVIVNGTRHDLEVVARNLTRPVALAFPPDGRIVIAERGGTIRIINHATGVSALAMVADDLREDGEVVVHDLVLHPDFARNRFVLVVYTVASPSGALTRVVRCREIGNTIGEAAVLLTVASSGPLPRTAAAAFTRDRTLLVATNDGDAGPTEAAVTGRLFHVKDDGTSDERPSAASVGEPIAIGQNRVTGRVWLVDRSDRPSAPDDRLERITIHDATAAGFYRGTGLGLLRDVLLVAFAGDARLEAWRFERAAGTWARQQIRLTHSLGRIGVLRGAPDGSLYLGSDRGLPAARDTIVRIEPAKPG